MSPYWLALKSILRRVKRRGGHPQSSQSLPRFLLLLLIPATLLVGVLDFYSVQGRKADFPVALPVPATSAKPEIGRLGSNLNDGLLTLTWDPLLPAIAGSTGGTLHIADGSVTQSVAMTKRDLGRGSFDYKPKNDQVDVRLTVYGAATESVLVIGAPRAQAKAVEGEPQRTAGVLPSPNFLLPVRSTQRLPVPPTASAWNQ